MASTTVVSDDSVTTVVEEASGFGHRISWSAIISGALVATAVTFFLLALGTGFGLSLVSAKHATSDDTVRFLTLGAVYFFAAQAFGFAIGGHITGRLMGPAPETAKEEEFLAGAHGLTTWALAVVATATMIYLAAVATGTAAMGGALVSGTAPNANAMTPAETSYWVDRLFRPSPQAGHASLAWHRFAQVDTGTANDSNQNTDTPQDSNTNDSSQNAPAPKPADRVEHLAPQPSMPPAQAQGLSSGMPMSTPSPADTFVPGTQPVNPATIAGDKAEVTRILNIGAAPGEKLSDVDRVQIAHLVAQDTGQTEDAADRRVENVEQQMQDDQTRKAETARKAAAYTSLWMALSLLFGAIVAVMSAVSARWEDDKISFGFPIRRAS